jgi:hypothetical protein
LQIHRLLLLVPVWQGMVVDHLKHESGVYG